MLNKSSGLFLGIASAFAIVGSAQAATLTPIATNPGNTTWQEIAEVSYTFADNNHDSVLDVGDMVTFSLAMHKDNWGTHRYDAMKVWLDDGSANLVTKQFKWYYDPSLRNMADYQQGVNDHYSYKPWTGGDKVFSFSYTFTKAGTYDLLASVICSRDLSGFYGSVDDSPTKADWKAWGENVHLNKPWLQGEDKTYRLTVAAVPEPGTYAMLIAGLGMLGAIARRRKQG